MPHDAKGNPLAVGDRVMIPAVVLAIHEGTEYCNLNVEFEYPMPPYTDKTNYSTLNTAQVVKVE